MEGGRSSAPSGLGRESSCIHCSDVMGQLAQLQADHDNVSYYWQESEKKAFMLENEVNRMRIDLDKKVQEFIEVTSSYDAMKEAYTLSARQLDRTRGKLTECQTALFQSLDATKLFEHQLESMLLETQERWSTLRDETTMTLLFLLDGWNAKMLKTRLAEVSIEYSLKAKMEALLTQLLSMEANHKASSMVSCAPRKPEEDSANRLALQQEQKAKEHETQEPEANVQKAKELQLSPQPTLTHSRVKPAPQQAPEENLRLSKAHKKLLRGVNRTRSKKPNDETPLGSDAKEDVDDKSSCSRANAMDCAEASANGESGIVKQSPIISPSSPTLKRQSRQTRSSRPQMSEIRSTIETSHGQHTSSHSSIDPVRVSSLQTRDGRRYSQATTTSTTVLQVSRNDRRNKSKTNRSDVDKSLKTQSLLTSTTNSAAVPVNVNELPTDHLSALLAQAAGELKRQQREANRKKRDESKGEACNALMTCGDTHPRIPGGTTTPAASVDGIANSEYHNSLVSSSSSLSVSNQSLLGVIQRFQFRNQEAAANKQQQQIRTPSHAVVSPTLPHRVHIDHPLDNATHYPHAAVAVRGLREVLQNPTNAHSSNVVAPEASRVKWKSGVSLKRDATRSTSPNDTKTVRTGRSALTSSVDCPSAAVLQRGRRNAKNMSRTRPKRNASKCTPTEDLVEKHKQGMMEMIESSKKVSGTVDRPAGEKAPERNTPRDSSIAASSGQLSGRRLNDHIPVDDGPPNPLSNVQCGDAAHATQPSRNQDHCADAASRAVGVHNRQSQQSKSQDSGHSLSKTVKSRRQPQRQPPHEALLLHHPESLMAPPDQIPSAVVPLHNNATGHWKALSPLLTNSRTRVDGCAIVPTESASRHPPVSSPVLDSSPWIHRHVTCPLMQQPNHEPSKCVIRPPHSPSTRYSSKEYDLQAPGALEECHQRASPSSGHQNLQLPSSNVVASVFVHSVALGAKSLATAASLRNQDTSAATVGSVREIGALRSITTGTVLLSRGGPMSEARIWSKGWSRNADGLGSHKADTGSPIPSASHQQQYPTAALFPLHTSVGSSAQHPPRETAATVAHGSPTMLSIPVPSRSSGLDLTPESKPLEGTSIISGDFARKVRDRFRHTANIAHSPRSACTRDIGSSVLCKFDTGLLTTTQNTQHSLPQTPTASSIPPYHPLLPLNRHGLRYSLTGRSSGHSVASSSVTESGQVDRRFSPRVLPSAIGPFPWRSPVMSTPAPMQGIGATNSLNGSPNIPPPTSAPQSHHGGCGSLIQSSFSPEFCLMSSSNHLESTPQKATMTSRSSSRQTEDLFSRHYYNSNSSYNAMPPSASSASCFVLSPSEPTKACDDVSSSPLTNQCNSNVLKTQQGFSCVNGSTVNPLGPQTIATISADISGPQQPSGWPGPSSLRSSTETLTGRPTKRRAHPNLTGGSQEGFDPQTIQLDDRIPQQEMESSPNSDLPAAGYTQKCHARTRSHDPTISSAVPTLRA